MVTKTLFAVSAVDGHLLADELAAADMVPRLVMHQIRRVADDAHRLGAVIDWTTLETTFKGITFGGWELRVTVQVRVP